MGLFVNPDCSAFKAAVASEIYIDKTSLIKHTNQMLGTLQAFVCNSRPRRFGKSVTADMLTAYYSKGADASELFQGLAISQIPGFTKHLNKYDVLHFDIQWCFKECGKAEATVPYITKIVLNELRQLYGKIVPDDVQKISGSPLVMSLQRVSKRSRMSTMRCWTSRGGTGTGKLIIIGLRIDVTDE